MKDIEEIKNMGKMSTKALLYMLETTVGIKTVETEFTYHMDSFSDGQEYITVYCNFTLRSDAPDPDGVSVAQKIMDIDKHVYPLISQYVLDSNGKLKKVSDLNYGFSDHGNSIWFEKCSYEFGEGEKNLFMTYSYESNIYLENED